MNRISPILLIFSTLAFASDGNIGDLVLLCKEQRVYDYMQTYDPQKPLTENQRLWFKLMNERNGEPGQYYFVIKNNKNLITYDNNGIRWLDNEKPGVVNDRGYYGSIAVNPNEIIVNVARRDGVAHLITIDRYTGHYEGTTSSERNLEMQYRSSGECSKKSEKLF